jgi:IS30 family transposase
MFIDRTLANITREVRRGATKLDWYSARSAPPNRAGGSRAHEL